MGRKASAPRGFPQDGPSTQGTGGGGGEFVWRRSKVSPWNKGFAQISCFPPLGEDGPKGQEKERASKKAS